MDVLVCKDSDDIAKRTYEWMIKSIQRGIRSFYIPAGATPLALYRILEEEWKHPTKRAVFETLKLVPVDDVITGEKAGIFRQFYKEYLPSFHAQLVPIAKQTQAQGAILGLGLNGHVAFHEPGQRESFEYGTVQLSALTCKELGIGLMDQGLTYGLGSFASCRRIAMMVSGEKKRAIFEKVFYSDDESTPASFLRAHEDFTVFVDEAAAKKNS